MSSMFWLASSWVFWLENSPHRNFPMLAYDWFDPARSPEPRPDRPHVCWKLPLQPTMSTAPEHPDHPPHPVDGRGVGDEAVAPDASQHRESDAARTLQRTYRGHRARRQLQGLMLDPSTRWVEVWEPLSLPPSWIDPIRSGSTRTTEKCLTNRER